MLKFYVSFVILLEMHILISLIFQVCKISEGQRYTKRLNEKQITALLKVTCQRPMDREKDILKVCFSSGYSNYSVRFIVVVTVKLPAQVNEPE